MKCSKRVHITPLPQKIQGAKLPSGQYEYETKTWDKCLCGKVKHD